MPTQAKFEPDILVNKLTILAGVMVVVIGFSGILFWSELTKNSPQFQHKPFDSTKWRDAADVAGMGDCTRIQMIDDLQNTQHLVGMQKYQLEQLLGKPNRQDGNVYVYTLGPQRSALANDVESLRVEFNKDTVSGTSVRTGN